ncbi:hypothetical protein ABRP63_11195 [Corynebacterium sp. KPL2623]|uniref:hypothetical protein n=1 Tax=Corynebacterium sp. KPL2623 TaxID=3158308 RepID=UPI0032EA9A22
MPWFKVDDGFYDHPKVLELDMAARGLWVMAGAYCARHLTDGVITGRQIRVIGGTQKQAEKLVAAGLWSADDAPPSVRRYAFNDWREFQPTREDVLSKRREDAERKRLARGVKRDKQQKRKNVRADVQADSEAPSALPGLQAPSALPGPARPDPTRPNSGTGSQPSNGDQGVGEQAGEISLDELAAATRRARQAGISDTAIKAGTQEFERRPHPKGPGLLRTLINDAAEAKKATRQAEEATKARRTAIDNCDLCDDNGMYYANGTAQRCDHKPPRKQPPF